MRGLFKGGKRKKKNQLLSPCAIVSHVHIRQNTASACLLYLIGNLIYTHPPLFLCNLCGMLTKGRGLPQYTQLYVTSRSIKMLPRFPFYLPFPFSLSVHLSLFLIHMCSAANTSNAVSLCYLHPCHLPSLSLPFPCLSPSLAAQVMSFFSSWILLPSPSLPSRSRSPPFPISGWLSKAQHLSTVASFPRVGGGWGMPVWGVSANPGGELKAGVQGAGSLAPCHGAALLGTHLHRWSFIGRKELQGAERGVWQAVNEDQRELQASVLAFGRWRGHCLDDLKPGKRLLPRGLQMLKQAPLPFFSPTFFFLKFNTGSSTEEENLSFLKK